MSLKIPKDEVWTMKDGTEIQVKNMTESHAKNAFRMLLRRVREHNERQRDIILDGMDNHMECWMDDDWGDR